MKRLTFHPRLPVCFSRGAVHGQALTEFLVVALALIPLLLLTPLISKYQDVANAVQMASRYVTFEAMTRNDAQSTWKTPGQLAGEVQRRFFSNPDAPVKTGDVAGNFTAHQNLFWRGLSVITQVDGPVFTQVDGSAPRYFVPLGQRGVRPRCRWVKQPGSQAIQSRRAWRGILVVVASAS